MTTTATAPALRTANFVNGLDVDALFEKIQAIEADPSKAKVGFRVRSDWQGQTRSRAVVDSYTLGGETIDRSFAFEIDEPLELLGENSAPNPQEVLMSALNACIMVGYVAGAAVKGITLDAVTIETHGELDLRGFLGLDPDVPAGYETVHYTVHIKGNGTDEEFREIHENVMKTSPNYFNISRPVKIEATLDVMD